MSIRIQSIDMKDILGIKKFCNLVCLDCAKKGFHMHTINLIIEGHTYTCNIIISKDVYQFQLMFENGFLTLMNDGSGSLKTRNIDFIIIDKFKDSRTKKLDTIFYLQTIFYRMIDLELIKIKDVATFLCKDGKTEYSALLYRIFATNKPLNELSIYYKYFKKFNRSVTDEKLSELLDEYRCMKYKDTIVSEYFKDFKDSEDCKEKALELQLFLQDKKINDFCNFLGEFSANTTDSIYWVKPHFKHKKAYSIRKKAHSIRKKAHSIRKKAHSIHKKAHSIRKKAHSIRKKAP